MIDDEALRGKDAKESKSTRIMRGADYSTDHIVLLTVKIRPSKRRGGLTARKFNTNKLKSSETAHNFEERTSTALEGSYTAT